MPIEAEKYNNDGGQMRSGRKYITFSEKREYGYTDVIEKVMRIKKPWKLHTIRTTDMTGIRVIRDGTIGKVTDYMIRITHVERIMLVRISDEFAKADLATDNPPITGSYKSDLLKLISDLHGHYPTAFMYINYLEPVMQNKQVGLDGEMVGYARYEKNR